MLNSSVKELEEFPRKAEESREEQHSSWSSPQRDALPSDDRPKKIEERDLNSNQAQISEFNKKIQNEVGKPRSDRWMQFVEENSRLTTGKIWKALGRITGKRSSQANSALKFDGKVVTEPQKAESVSSNKLQT